MNPETDKLLRVAGSGDAAKVRKMIAGGAGVNSSNDIGYSGLMSAARSYRHEVVSLLIEHGADVNAVTTDGQSVLHAAIGETPSQPDQQGKCVRAMLAAGANANASTSIGHTPLMMAAWFGCPDAASALLEN